MNEQENRIEILCQHVCITPDQYIDTDAEVFDSETSNSIEVNVDKTRLEDDSTTCTILIPERCKMSVISNVWNDKSLSLILGERRYDYSDPYLMHCEKNAFGQVKIEWGFEHVEMGWIDE